MAPSLVLYGLAPHLLIAALGLMATGACYMASISSFTSVTQRAAPPELRGRAMVVNNFTLGAFYPLGLLVQGVIADRTSLRTVTAGAGVLLGVFAVWLWARPASTAAITHLDHQPSRAVTAR